MERGGTILAETVREVDEDLIDDNGFIAARDLPPRGETRPSLPRRPPSEPRLTS
jgi:hypothetical protein